MNKRVWLVLFGLAATCGALACSTDAAAPPEDDPLDNTASVMCNGTKTKWCQLKSASCTIVPCADPPTSINGCGPSSPLSGILNAGGWLGAKAAAWLSTNPGAFNTCCGNHDAAYGRCATSDPAGARLSADQDLQNCMLASCQAAYPSWWSSPAYTACIQMAEVIYGAVRAGGSGAFQSGQEGACTCAPSGGSGGGADAAAATVTPEGARVVAELRPLPTPSAKCLVGTAPPPSPDKTVTDPVGVTEEGAPLPSDAGTDGPCDAGFIGDASANDADLGFDAAGLPWDASIPVATPVADAQAATAQTTQ